MTSSEKATGLRHRYVLGHRGEETKAILHSLGRQLVRGDETIHGTVGMNAAHVKGRNPGFVIRAKRNWRPTIDVFGDRIGLSNRELRKVRRNVVQIRELRIHGCESRGAFSDHIKDEDAGDWVERVEPPSIVIDMRIGRACRVGVEKSAEGVLVEDQLRFEMRDAR